MVVCLCRGLSDSVTELCRSLGDNRSRALLEGILKDEEWYANWIEAQLGLIQQAGEGHYLAQQIKADD